MKQHSAHVKNFLLIGFLSEQIALRGNFKATGRLLKPLQFLNKNFKTKWHVRSGQKVILNQKVILDQTKKKLFSAKNIININNLKKETPIRK